MEAKWRFTHLTSIWCTAGITDVSRCPVPGEAFGVRVPFWWIRVESARLSAI